MDSGGLNDPPPRSTGVDPSGNCEDLTLPPPPIFGTRILHQGTGTYPQALLCTETLTSPTRDSALPLLGCSRPVWVWDPTQLGVPWRARGRLCTGPKEEGRGGH